MFTIAASEFAVILLEAFRATENPFIYFQVPCQGCVTADGSLHEYERIIKILKKYVTAKHKKELGNLTRTIRNKKN